MTAYRTKDGTYTRDELRERVVAEAATLPADQWTGDKFDFDEWLDEATNIGQVTVVDDDL